MKTFGERIADALIADGVLTPEQLSEVLESQKKQGGRMLKLLLERGYVTELDMISSMGRVVGAPPINLAKVHVPPEVLELVPKDMAISYKMAAVSRLGRKLFIAMADPLNVLALDELRRVRPNFEIVPLIATEKAVLDFLNQATAPDTHNIEQILKDADVSDVEVPKEQQEEINLDRLVESSEEGPVIKLVNLILVQAVKDRASDIHIEPFEKSVRLRYRIDGVLYDSAAPPKSLQAAIASRIKIMAHLDIAERRLPQDGRFRIKVAGRDVDLRVSVLPTVHGEKIVMRVLDKSTLNTKLENIGMDEDSLAKFRAAIDAPHGMMLMTGPTGSGKTSTLYAVLSHLNQPDVNIVTVEDPVEYQMHGINQVQVKSDIGLTFAAGLRSILRQDPDIVMVGEIRDSETADIAVKAALTGHLVLSTLHTNDAPGAVARLIDMGIEPFLVSSSVLLVCAQRLVRKICPHCKEEFVLPPESIRQAGLKEAEVAGATFYRGRGCGRCKDTGFLGRTAIHEVMAVSDAIREQILHDASAKVIRELAIKEGMKTLRESGLQKAKQGITSVDEVLRVTGREV
ncbi:MAG: type IV-A pilus assembly ATPase PilB [Verrucomicrobiae bacterium]|nr:type IV-A pilus assembly ATPase PilB [Verrucomicrobiae bacterium]MDW8343232.1 type IV-A pilus assembly ATPase PilB [Verrucomicrobiae bacterium]